MAAAAEDERGWTAGQLHHCQERPICRNKGLHLSYRRRDLAQRLYRRTLLDVPDYLSVPPLGQPHISSLDEQGTGMGNRVGQGSTDTGDDQSERA